MKVSAIIPARNEIFLAKTIDDLFAKAKGELEVVAVLDGYWPDPPLKERPGLVILHKGEAQGMREAENSATAIATGDFLLKCDAHCMFGEGYDEILKAECDYGQVVVPRRVSLEPEKWEIANTGKSPVDAHFLCWPWGGPDSRGGFHQGLHGQVWKERAYNNRDILFDDEMSSQGSCWFMRKKHFMDHLFPLDTMLYGNFIQEFQEIGLKTWLGGGACKIQKKTWYAHLHKGKTYGRMWPANRRDFSDGLIKSMYYWMNNRWAERKYDITWLVEKFWPVPTWPENWQEQLPELLKQEPK
jgi:hypothetical protein